MNNVDSPQNIRLQALKRFAFTITLVVFLGHTVLGFEQSWAQHLVGLATAYSVEIILEFVDAKTHQRTPRFAGSFTNLVEFLLPAHIVGLTVATILYPNKLLLPIIFAVAVAIASKAIFRVPVGKGSRHFLNPTNFGIVTTLVIFPWAGVTPPFSFTTDIFGIWDWILPLAILISGTMLNAQLTGKMPLIAAWLIGFVVQAYGRSYFLGTSLIGALTPMTGVLFILVTFYMITDPGTSPRAALPQVIYGFSIAAIYGLLIASRFVYAIFFAITIVCLLRGLALLLQAWLDSRADNSLSVVYEYSKLI